MALTKCPECGNPISKKAKACPQCGHTKKEPTKYGCGTLLLVILLGGVFMNIMNPGSPSTSQPKAPPKPKTAEEQRTDTIERAFSAWDGSHRELERFIKKNLKDPKSYEHIETRYTDNGDHLTVFTQYRAKNSFGGYTVGTMVAKANLDGSLIEIVSSD